jgi:hypothetical protein
VLAPHQRFIRVFEEEWRALECERDDAVRALARAMADSKTGLLEGEPPRVCAGQRRRRRSH